MSRPRKRRHGDDDDDSIPISKRINRLQIETEESLEINNNVHIRTACDNFAMSPMSSSRYPTGFSPLTEASDDSSSMFDTMDTSAAMADATSLSGLQPTSHTASHMIPTSHGVTSISWGHSSHSNAACGQTNEHNRDLRLPQMSMTSLVDDDVTDLDNGRYSPELNNDENPYYYDINRVLYEANVSRLQRVHSHIFLPDK